VSGLTNGTERFFAMGIRPTGGSTWTQAGQVLRARPSATTIHIDASASAGGNGSLGTPFRTLQEGFTAAAGNPNANVWVRDGSYTTGLLSPGTHVYGGFATFSISDRDPSAGNTVVTPGSFQAALEANTTGTRVIIDGFLLDGNGIGFYGIDQQNVDLDVRSVTIREFVDRGIRLRNNSTNENLKVQLVACTVQSNGADGVNVFGPFDLTIDASAFDANAQEGIDCAPLVALPSLSSTLAVTHSRFANNGAEGLDASLDRPLGVTAGSASFDVSVSACTFSGNALDGLLIDQEHEAAVGWTMRAVVRDCVASNNALAGVHVDFDALGQVMLHGIRATANGTDGIFISSEISSGHAVVSASHLAGNLGAGIRTSTGNKIVVASHCVFAGNLGGGLVSASAARDSVATNCIFDLQPSPTTLVRSLGNATTDSSAAAVFVNAPIAYGRANSHSNGVLTMSATPTFGAGLHAELADDGTDLTISQVVGQTVILGSTPTILRLPAGFAAFPSTSITDNLALSVSSAAIAQGMKEAGAADVDAGPVGSPLGNTPGVAAEIPEPLFWLDQVTPAPNVTLTSQSVTLRFSDNLSGATLTNTSVRVLNQAGVPVVIAIDPPSLNTVVVRPPGGGWPSGQLRLELHRAVGSSTATIAHPTIYPLR
ncbi:MAG: right-handed parallel beta-helix repeat-containing protein, partial [Planctomycetota bacterium]